MRAGRRVAVLGAGAWGTALAVLIARGGRPAVLWGRDPERLARLAAARSNERYLPGVGFPPALAVEACLEEALGGAEIALIAVPSAAFEELLEQLLACAPGRLALLWATKGFLPGSARLLHERVAERAAPGDDYAVLSGPTFAAEVGRGLPAAVVVASPRAALARRVAALLHGPRFRAYTSSDVVGVEIGGAVKNVLAIAAGIADGLGLGANTRAALVARGLREMGRLGEALGARRETLMGLSGLGDLVLTCTDDQSRNRRFGLEVGRGAGVAEARARVGQTIEGYDAAAEVVAIARARGVELPICAQVEAVLHRGVDPREAVETLLARPPAGELDPP